MDITGLSVFGFALVKVILWLVVVVFAIAIGRRVMKQANPEDVAEGEVAPQVGDVLWSNKGRIGIWVVLFAATIIYTQVEMGYRPKTVVQPANPVLKEQLRELDQTAATEIGPAEGDQRDAANRDYSQRNREQNEAAREAFGKLPDDS